MSKKIFRWVAVLSLAVSLTVPVWGSTEEEVYLDAEPAVIEEGEQEQVSESPREDTGEVVSEQDEIINTQDAAAAKLVDITVDVNGKREYYYKINGYYANISMAGFEFKLYYDDGSEKSLKMGDYTEDGAYIRTDVADGWEHLDDDGWLLPGNYTVNCYLESDNIQDRFITTSVDITLSKLDMGMLPLLQDGDADEGNFFLDDDLMIYTFWSEQGGTYLFPIESSARTFINLQNADTPGNLMYSGPDNAFYNLEPYTHYYVIINNYTMGNQPYKISCKKVAKPVKIELLEYPKSLNENENMEQQFRGSLKVKISYDNGEEKELSYSGALNLTDGNGNNLLLDYDKRNIWKSFTDRSPKPGTHTIDVRLGKMGDDEWQSVYPAYDAKATFKVQVGNGINLSKASVKLSKTSLAYTGKAQSPAVTVKYNNAALKKGTDYTVTYKNNKAIGKATVTIKGKGAYTGTKSVSYKIVPRTASVSSAKALGKGKVKINWKRDKTVTGYQIYTCSKKNGSYKKAKTVTGNTKITYTIVKQKKGSLYVKVRAYKKVGKTNYYGALSAAKGVKVK